MSGATTSMNASLTLRLQDRLSAGLGVLKQRLDGIRAAAERIGAMGALGSAFAVGAPIAAAARFDDQLRAIAITAGLSGAAAEAYIDKLRRSFQLLALQTGQTADAVAAAAGLMIQRGLPAELIDKLLPVTARVATAASADMRDIAGVVESINTALGVMPDQLDRGMAMLVVAAKEGKVELKDMAKEFPALAAAANNFGLKGLDGVKVLASAMQVAAKASATPAEAANNMANLFQALTRPETLKHFKEKFGTDFPAVIKDAEKKGLNPLEVALQKIMDLTRGDPFKLGELIGDLQAGRALLPFLKDFGAEYLRIREVVNGASPEAITTDFQTRMAGPAVAMGMAAEILSQLTERFGRELFGRIDVVLAPLRSLLDLLALMDEMAPGLVGRMVRFTAAFLVLAAVLGTLVTVLPIFLAGMRVIGLVLRAAFFFVPLLTNGLAALAAVAGTIAAPIVAVLAVLALLGGIAYTIWANWSEFEGFFSGMWGGLRAMLQGFIRFLDGVFSLDMAKAIAGLRLMWEGFSAFFESLWGALSLVMDKWVDGAGTWINEQLPRLINAFKSGWESLKTWFSEFWTTMTAPIVAFIEKVEGFFNRMQQRREQMPQAPLGIPEPSGLMPNFVNPASYTVPRNTVMGEIVVRAATGTTVEDIVYRGPVGITPGAPVPDRGSLSPLARA